MIGLLTIAAIFALGSTQADQTKRQAEIDQPMQMCGVTVGSAKQKLAELSQAAAPDDITEADNLIRIRQNGFERIWMFTTPKHPAYPAVVCNWPRQRDDKFDMGMDGKCGIDGDACLAFFAERKFENARLVQQMRAVRGER